MPTLAAVRRRNDVPGARAPRLEDSRDRGRSEIRSVRQADDGRFDFRAEGCEGGSKRRTGPALPLGAVDDARVVHVEWIGARDDDDLVDGRSSQPLEDAREEEELLRRTETARGSGRQHHRCDHKRENRPRR